jgi:ribosomal protein L37AE/L43A
MDMMSGNVQRAIVGIIHLQAKDDLNNYMRNCPKCKKHTFENIIEYVWQCNNSRCEFNSNCFGCESGECQKQTRQRSR